MRPRPCWLILILLPLCTSCSAITGLVKKPPYPAQAAQAPQPPQAAPKVEQASPESAREDDGAFHIVGRGETLRHICSVYGLDLKKVAEVNDLRTPYSLKMGDTIFLPADALLGGGDPRGAIAGAARVGRPQSLAAADVCAVEAAAAIRGNRHPAVPKLKFPVPRGVLTSPFGFRWGVFHKGLDIAAPVGQPVLACGDAQVLFTGRKENFGKYGRIVLLDHGKGVYTQYAHLDQIHVKKGQKVKRGQKIATVGNTGNTTGPHLHLEVRVRNQMYNPLAYFTSSDLKGMQVAKRFTTSPMGPVKARWEIPDLVTARR